MTFTTLLQNMLVVVALSGLKSNYGKTNVAFCAIMNLLCPQDQKAGRFGKKHSTIQVGLRRCIPKLPLKLTVKIYNGILLGIPLNGTLSPSTVAKLSRITLSSWHWQGHYTCAQSIRSGSSIKWDIYFNLFSSVAGEKTSEARMSSSINVSAFKK